MLFEMFINRILLSFVLDFYVISHLVEARIVPALIRILSDINHHPSAGAPNWSSDRNNKIDCLLKTAFVSGRSIERH